MLYWVVVSVQIGASCLFILWMDEIPHHFKTMGNHCLLVFTGESSFYGFSGDAGLRPSTVVFSFADRRCVKRLNMFVGLSQTWANSSWHAFLLFGLIGSVDKDGLTWLLSPVARVGCMLLGSSKSAARCTFVLQIGESRWHNSPMSQVYSPPCHKFISICIYI